MANRSNRARYVVALSVPIAVLVALVIGPTFLKPLPMWVQLVIAGAGCLVIAAIAVYARRHARRSAQTR